MSRLYCKIKDSPPRNFGGLLVFVAPGFLQGRFALFVAGRGVELRANAGRGSATDGFFVAGCGDAEEGVG